MALNYSNKGDLGPSQDSGSENHHFSMIVLTGLLVDDQPPVVAVNM